jgi:hypothetical protein
MNKYAPYLAAILTLSLIVLLFSCKPIFRVSFSVKNESASNLSMRYLMKGTRDTLATVIKPNQTLVLLKKEKEGSGYDFEALYPLKIISIMNTDSSYAWKDFNVEGAWENDARPSSLNAVLHVRSDDFWTE